MAAHSEVGEGEWARGEMIVIEYEMSITWNEHAIQVGRGSEDSFFYLRDKLRSLPGYSCLPASLSENSYRAVAQLMYGLISGFIPPSKQQWSLKNFIFATTNNLCT